MTGPKTGEAVTRKYNSPYPGVTWSASRSRWSARIKVGKKTIYLGNFREAEKAYEAYCTAAYELRGIKYEDV